MARKTFQRNKSEFCVNFFNIPAFIYFQRLPGMLLLLNTWGNGVVYLTNNYILVCGITKYTKIYKIKRYKYFYKE